MKNNDFDQELKYRLYRNVREILHPTISKKNISNYKIIVDSDLMPLRIFYPKKVSNMKKVIIFIHGDGFLTDCSFKYSEILSNVALEFDQLVISIDYDNSLKLGDLYSKIFDTFNYVLEELLENGIRQEDITVMGDSTGASCVLAINTMFDGVMPKQVLFYPLVSGKYFGKSKFTSIENADKENKDLLGKVASYYMLNVKFKKDLRDKKLFALLNDSFNNYPSTLILCGEKDFLLDEDLKLAELLGDKAAFMKVMGARHGFLKDIIDKKELSYIEDIKNFIN